MSDITKWRMVLCGAVVAACTASSLSQNLLTNPGMETAVVIPTDLPSAGGLWSHDVASIVTAQNGITPHSGSRMLHFIYTAPYGPADSWACEVYQLVDMTAFADLIRAGQATAVGSGWFNRVAGDSQTDKQFAIEIRAYSGAMSAFPDLLTFGEIGMKEQQLSSDANPSTWERIEVSFPIPQDTTFLALRVYAGEDVYNDLSGIELDGHYGDDFSFTIVPEPSQRIGTE